MSTNKPRRETVVLCDNCFQAACWDGTFMCSESKNAGVIEVDRRLYGHWMGLLRDAMGWANG